MDIGGRVLFFGGLPKDKEIVPINTNAIHYKELIVTGSTRANNEQFRKTLEFIAEGILEVKSLVTARFPINEMDKAMEYAIQAKGLKNIITF